MGFRKNTKGETTFKLNETYANNENHSFKEMYSKPWSKFSARNFSQFSHTSDIVLDWLFIEYKIILTSLDVLCFRKFVLNYLFRYCVPLKLQSYQRIRIEVIKLFMYVIRDYVAENFWITKHEHKLRDEVFLPLPQVLDYGNE